MPRTATLDQIKQHEICALLACGASRRQAAEYVECATTTIANTARRDPDFAERLRRAECNYALRNLRAINRAASRSWRAAAWALREHDPGEFGANRERSVPPASVARAAARDTPVGVPASAGPTASQTTPVVGHKPPRSFPVVGQKPPFRYSTPTPSSERPAIQPIVPTRERAEQVRWLTSDDRRPAPVVGHNPPCNFPVIGQKPPVGHATSRPDSEQPATRPTVHARECGEQARRLTPASYKTTLFWAAAIVACFLLGHFQPVLPALRDGAPFGDATSDLHSPVQPPAAAQQPIVGHNPPSNLAAQQPIVGHEPPSNASAAWAADRAITTASRNSGSRTIYTALPLQRRLLILEPP